MVETCRSSWLLLLGVYLLEVGQVWGLQVWGLPVDDLVEEAPILECLEEVDKVWDLVVDGLEDRITLVECPVKVEWVGDFDLISWEDPSVRASV
jgi:hypothetical protein